MKVIVLGSGVVGVSSAYYLARKGHEVTVIDRQPGPAEETSFANAGEVSPGYSAPWAAPGIPLKAVKWLFMKHRPLVIWPRLDPAMWVWGLRMLMNCTSRRYEINKGRMLRLAEYSRDELKALRASTGIQYDERAKGTLQLFRTEKQLAGCVSDTLILDRFGVPYEVLDVAGCIAVEPALARVKEKFVGGLRLPGDETGDCFKFTGALAQMAIEAGVTFRYGTSIEALEHDATRVTGVRLANGRVTADAYVVCLGSFSPQMVAPLGISLPVYPVKGYSITVPITDATGAPESTVMDETFKVAVTRLGDRIRVGGTAELAGYSTRLREARRGTLNHVVSDLFPQGGDVAAATFWTGLRPMTPDGTPYVCKTGYGNLFLNTGHGTLGWTMATGSAQVTSDLISTGKAAIDTEGFGLDRT